MRRDEFAQPYVVALYKLHRRQPDSTWSVKDIIIEFDVPRDDYLEQEMVELLEAQNWAFPLREMGIGNLDIGMRITYQGKTYAESLIEKGLVIRAHSIVPAEAPASDRLVSLSDNNHDVKDLRSQLSLLEEGLERGNDIGTFNTEELIAARSEVSALQSLFESSLIRADLAWHAATRTLKWIADKASAAAIGEIAKIALKLIAAALGIKVT